MDNSKKSSGIAELLINGPQYDLIGPTVEHDIRRVISRYGADAVKQAVKNVTRPKRGRKPERDWPELREVINADAREWLAGGDPFVTRTNYSIARDFSLKKPGQSPSSAHKRIERKLAKAPYDRRWFMLVTAENISRDGFPHEQHIRALEALAELNREAGGDTWRKSLELARQTIADYTAKMGESPSAEVSMKEIEEVARNPFPLLSGPTLRSTNPKQMSGLFGLLPSVAAKGGDLD